MPYKIDFFDGELVEWSLSDRGATSERVLDYTPTFYVGRGEGDEHSLADAQSVLEQFPTVARTVVEERRPGFRHNAENVVRVDLTSVDEIPRMARWIHEWGDPGEYRCFNVDFSREFRYCLETGRDPTPARTPTTLSIEGQAHEFSDSEVPALSVGGEQVGRSPDVALPRIEEIVDRRDPDVLLVDSSQLLAELHGLADRYGYGLQLGRRLGFQQLAGASTYTSYGRVGHSPARYNVPGRVILDLSNTFFYRESNLDGCLDLVRRSGKPLQELAWASIGNVLTAIQIREALSRNVLVPWKAWRPEQFKTMRQLHNADRGGFTFAPDVGVHENVHELDFSSLYPNIICTRNVSPEKIQCECHRGREDVPGLGYCICDERGYLPDVLQPLIDDRDEIKAELRAIEDPDRRAELEGRSAAIKWILVSCFGYQGFSNAKFGRIECHEAINAFAREILLDAKTALEDGGWRVVHGIVDSIWVTPREGVEQESLDVLAGQITADVGIHLEYEAEYDWVAFVPMRDSDAGALTKYFGAVADGEKKYKYRGIECRQRSTSPFVAGVQRELIETFDEYRSPEAVCDRVQAAVQRLRDDDVDPAELAVTTRASKRVDEYQHTTRTVAALEAASNVGREVQPGESVEFVVVDDSKASQDRVALVDEAEDYDAEYYRGEVLRAAESVLSPLGWREGDIRGYLADRVDVGLSRY
ncbi:MULTISPECIES: type B DNA-directed DNA polymerase [Halorussus]|uniref:type B DNA-directed DNA polymerase n=1 Tax=Halorussus TaxID=1070314 RepID=UPI0020A059F7|nr:type B DNA-directed DNA polymerase [Halorussus vallis]USZ78710.1 type B DNA-directed DNA polymerase [Halorussus vallis]